MKSLIFLFLLMLNLTGWSQAKYMTRSGEVKFEASVPSFEPVAAAQNAVTAILDTENGHFASLALVKGFRFKNALMEEHFNENYAESSQYPKATLTGVIENFSIQKLSEQWTVFNLVGNFTFHGVTQDLRIPVEIKMEDGNLQMKADFSLNPENFNIDIPSIIRNKVAKNVLVEVNFLLRPQ